MWTDEQRALFIEANSHFKNSNYHEALRAANELLAIVKDTPQKAAYVLGCRKAVALRRLSRREEAEDAFVQAYTLAWNAGELAIMAYIYYDWSAIYQGKKVVQMLREAVSLCTQAESTPDNTRILEADLAYFQAALAHALEMEGPTNREEVKELIINAKATLEKYTSRNPLYEQAYRILLLWEIQSAKNSPLVLLRNAGNFGTTAMVAIRGGKIGGVITQLEP